MDAYLPRIDDYMDHRDLQREFYTGRIYGHMECITTCPKTGEYRVDTVRNIIRELNDH